MEYQLNGELTPTPTVTNEVANSANLAKPECFENINGNDYNYIPDSVYNTLPKLLKESCDIFLDKREKDVYLTGALSALGGCFSNVFAYNEIDKTKVSPNLFSFIVAPPASGKGALKYGKKLIRKIVDTFGQNCRNLNRMKCRLLIPANNSSAGLVKLLQANNGSGVMIESEIDTLANSQKQEWGKYSDLIRHGFENEDYLFYRKTNNEFIKIEKVKLSLAVSGTPEQFKNLMVSTENGLFSRGCFYIFNDDSSRLKCFGRINSDLDIDDLFEKFAETANSYYEKLLEFESVKVCFPSAQMECIQSVLQKEYSGLFQIVDLQSNIKRAFITVQKIASILAILDTQLNEIKEEIQCSPTCFANALLLTLTYLKHSYKAFDMLPKTSTRKLGIMETKLLLELPDAFSRKEAVAIGDKLQIKPRSVDKHIRNLIKVGYLENDGAGKFHKPKTE